LNFIDLLLEILQKISNYLDQQRADDIKRFTYVTVIFLPLGFSTGLFSMSRAPGSLTLAYMIATAVSALLITAIILLNSEGVESL
jgi:Mg2+ and Co2+ transporter CorA